MASSEDERCRRLFLKKLKSTLKIPVLALVDSDPYGLKILSVYMKVRHSDREISEGSPSLNSII